VQERALALDPEQLSPALVRLDDEPLRGAGETGTPSVSSPPRAESRIATTSSRR
jgi:hypothetical protein